MTRLILALLLFATAAWSAPVPGPSAAPSPVGTITLKPLTFTFWNLEWFPGNRPKANVLEKARHIELVHEIFGKMRPDIVGMSEVHDYAAAELAIKTLPGFKVDVCANFPAGSSPDTQQVAIASRLQPLSAWAERWKSGPQTPPRGFVFAAYQLAPQKVLLVYVVHFKSNRGNTPANAEMREESSRQLLDHIGAMEKAYEKLGNVNVWIGGDFNTSLDDERFKNEKTIRNLQAQGFRWSWQNMRPSERVTIPGDGRFPPGTFDHIFYRGGTLVKAWVTETTIEASDHRPVSVTIAP
jgi:endonuclease/exonuclease/phosphatase family metal-dependent hydrolase